MSPPRCGSFSATLAALSGFTHFDQAGNAAMVDVSDKAVTARTATARARVVMAAATLAMIQQGSAKKGDVLGVARLAGIMGAKRTADLIPLCHPLPITSVKVDLTPTRRPTPWRSPRPCARPARPEWRWKR